MVGGAERSLSPGWENASKLKRGGIMWVRMSE